ncbi:hypothetical protein NHF40_02045 [Maricaulaceae bacterium EIL42A08]|nr:hypothetical protein [Maricaulaceae bacterium EIL42A08]
MDWLLDRIGGAPQLGSLGFSYPFDLGAYRPLDRAELEEANIFVEGELEKNFVISAPGAQLNKRSGRLKINFSKRSERNIVALGLDSKMRGEIKFGGRGNCLYDAGRGDFHCAAPLIIKANLPSDDCLIFIGKDVTANGLFVSAAHGGNILIGEDCMISAQCGLRGSDMHAVFDTRNFDLVNKGASERRSEVILFPHVWMGEGAYVIKDSIIGPGSVIGAKSLVTKSFEDGRVIEGVPAKTLRRNAGWHRSFTPDRAELEVLAKRLKLYRRVYLDSV